MDGMRWIGSVATLGAAGLILVSAAPARACTCAAAAIFESDPVAGATGVPLDVVPIIHGWFRPESVEIVSEAGDSVPVEVTSPVPGLGGCAGQSTEVRPLAPLAANTSYVVRARSLYEPDSAPPSAVEFRTGDTPLEDRELSPPTAVITVLNSELFGDMCGGTNRACIHVQGADEAEILLRTAGESVGRAYLQGSRLSTATFLPQIPDCIEVRARRKDGTRSEPTVLCQGDFVQREAQRSDYYDLDLRCESGLIGDDIGGGDPLPSGSDAPPDGVAGGSAAPPGAESDPPSSGTDNDGQAPTTEQPDTAQSSSGRSKRASWGCSTAPGAIDPAGASIGLLWLLTVVRRRRMQVA
jgi:hypothetical protein